MRRVSADERARADDAPKLELVYRVQVRVEDALESGSEVSRGHGGSVAEVESSPDLEDVGPPITRHRRQARRSIRNQATTRLAAVVTNGKQAQLRCAHDLEANGTANQRRFHGP